jgi:hypothetical protein
MGDELVVMASAWAGDSQLTRYRSGFLADDGGQPGGSKTDAGIQRQFGGMAINERGELIGVPTIVVSGIEVTARSGDPPHQHGLPADWPGTLM